MAQPVYLTASGIVGTSGVAVTMVSLFITGGAAAGTLNLRNGTSVAAPIRASFAVPIATTISPTMGASGLYFSQGLYVDFASNIANVTVGIT